jgi:colanic acid/amylovoran biosynthesis glycosyltransferase
MSEHACAYLVSRYPSVTHTFVVNEVRGLRARGVRVETASVRRVGDEEVLGETHAAEQRSTHALLPVKPWRLVAAHARALLRAPGAYVSTLAEALRLAHDGGRARLWQLFYFGEAILLWRWMSARGVRHVHVHHANVSADVALLACRYANRAGAAPRWTWSLTVHGPTELVDLATHKLALKVADAAAVVCISDFARSQVLALPGSDPVEHVHRVFCGINLMRFAPRPDPPGEDGPLHVLCVAAMFRRKGHRVLLEAMADLRERGVAARLTLVGDGPERASLERLAGELGLGAEGTVEFTGALDNECVAELYRAVDAFCLPSFSEGVPTVLMEAMACELPVVACRIAGTPELVEDGVSGLLVHPARADLLAGALARLAGDRELRERLGRAGRARVQEAFDERDSAANLHAVLAPLIAL